MNDTTDINKVVRIGTIPTYGGARVSVYCEIKYNDGDLSISGVIGPTYGGNAVGGAGQIDMEFAHRDPADNDSRESNPITPDAFNFAPGWDAERWLDFLDIWKRWHLNKMQPACEHQRALGWSALARDERTLYHWQLTSDASRLVRRIKQESEQALARGETVTLTTEEVMLVGLSYFTTTTSDEPPSAAYERRQTRATETKTLGWLRPEDHPDGLLTKPCPECGYRYGSAWLHEDVPGDVLTFLSELPDTDQQPAWV